MPKCNCCEFLASYAFTFQSVIKSYFKIPVSGAPLSYGTGVLSIIISNKWKIYLRKIVFLTFRWSGKTLNSCAVTQWPTYIISFFRNWNDELLITQWNKVKFNNKNAESTTVLLLIKY